MNERIRLLRKHLGLTADAFGEAIGIVRSAVSNIESGRRQPTNQLITSICREFNVNETWLRTGDGEMFNALSMDEQLAFYLGTILSEQGDTFKKRLIAALSALDESEWAAVEAFARKLVEQSRDAPPNKEGGCPPPFSPPVCRHSR